MKYKDLRDFIRQLEAKGELVRITQPIDTDLEMTEIADRTLRAGGPALLFENPVFSCSLPPRSLFMPSAYPSMGNVSPATIYGFAMMCLLLSAMTVSGPYSY